MSAVRMTAHFRKTLSAFARRKNRLDNHLGLYTSADGHTLAVASVPDGPGAKLLSSRHRHSTGSCNSIYVASI